MIDDQTRNWKTVLFIPANKPKYLASAIALKPDAVQLDLEDSVTPEYKEQARALVKSACRELQAKNIATIVRINNEAPHCTEDLIATVSPYVDAITIPKLESIAQIEVIEQQLSQLETKQGLPTARIKLLGLIETLAGLRNREGWQHAPSRLAGLALGSEDLCQQLACKPSAANLTEPCRQLLYAAREAALTAWGMPISIGEFNDLEGLELAMQFAKDMGMDGVWCIHPKQLEIAKRVFRTSDAERAEAQKIVDAFESATANGDGAVNVDGSMVDLPVYRRALELLNR